MQNNNKEDEKSTIVFCSEAWQSQSASDGLIDGNYLPLHVIKRGVLTRLLSSGTITLSVF